ncbi:biopolymer transporter ExbD [Curvibacter sp. APW13]|uniref:ExbD/TolR family protein n=1 Tax=Curvibacter sp. APW13 TaxID=3077236 RepID=UPI0028DE77A6|nr:biopolymer transporter ExbD [Curvibacter sp. APW13]MDT8992108.1 biopolymer transporter ExbD [Curvibacter sp. APW13]
MSFGLQNATSDDDAEVMSEINMTPLVDVMLVLLIIFIITVPVMKHAVNVELPQASAQIQSAKPETVSLSVDAQGQYFVNQNAVSREALPALLQSYAQAPVQPDLHIRGDKAVRYEYVAQAMAMAQQAGLRKIGFITEPVR